MIEIIKFQENLKHYQGFYDQHWLATKTSGWTICKQYAGSAWVKKVSWAGNWESYFRVANQM